MGREWLYKGSRARDDGGGKSPSTVVSNTTKGVNGKRRKEKERNNSSFGCMSAIFNLFDIQHHNHQFRFNHLSFISESTMINHPQSNFALQGVEAPRNSLESPESDMNVLQSTSKVKHQTNLNIPMGGIQIKTQRSRFTEDVSSEYSSSSPGTKTPNLIARLMGLDLLPEYSSPRPSSSSTPATSHNRSRSLPTTPRVSSASRRSTENKDYHHRLSLQIDKENCHSCRGHEHETLQMKMARRRSELLVNRKGENGGSQYAKEIANQVRERIGRRLGTDITNTLSSTSRNKEQRRDSNLVLLKSKKRTMSSLTHVPTNVSVQALASSTKGKQDESTQFPSSQKLRLLDIKSNVNKPTSNSKLSKSKLVKDEKMKRITSERYDLRLRKSTSLPNHGIKKVKNATKFLSFKKEMTSPSSTTRLPQKQVSLVKSPCNLNSPYKANDIHVTTTTDSVAKGKSFSEEHDHFDYISRILNQCGIYSTTPITFGQWYSPKHPIHPSIFNQLEKPHHSPATAKRRMIFELVNEFLVEIVKPSMNEEPWVCTRPYNKLENVIPPESFTMLGSELVENLCKKIMSFPTASCEALEDLDRLIATDISRSTLWSTAFATDELVMEIENEIVEMLVYEITTTFTDRLRPHVLLT